MNIIKKIMDSGSKKELMSIAAGQFFLSRPKTSPKATLECLYNDATLVIRESGPHVYDLVVQKDVDDTELASGDASEDFEDDELSVLSTQSKKDEEWSFTLNEALRFHKRWNEQGEVAFVWKNIKGDPGEKFQFVVNPEIRLSDVEQFLQAVYRCEYEFKYKKSANGALKEDLKQFEFSHHLDDSAIFSDEDEELTDVQKLGDKFDLLKVEQKNSDLDDDSNDEFEDAQEDVITSSNSPRDPKKPTKLTKGESIYQDHADIYIYDCTEESFAIQDTDAKVVVCDFGKFEFWLSIESNLVTLGTDVSPDINPLFDTDSRAFIFNYSFENITLSYMLKFRTQHAFSKFQSLWSKLIWESLNKQKWSTISQGEQEYVICSNKAVEKELTDFLHAEQDGDSSDSSSSEEESDDDEQENDASFSDVGSFDEKTAEKEYKDSTTLGGNKSLTVSYRNDRAFVVRGNKVGVFKADDENDEVTFVTAINNVSDLKGKSFNPENPMLYTEDRAMIIQDENDKSRVYKMDLERGQVVEEWSAGNKEILRYGPTKKFDQLTSEQTFLGISDKSVFKVDPRIGGANKLVNDENKDYATKYKFSSLGSTENGHVAIGSEKGEIRLYDRLGIRAKTLIPALGEPINHICASADGKWLLATCNTSLLLIDLVIKEGKNAGHTGFLKSFSKQEMPKIYILRIHPKTASYMKTSTKQAIKFTKAYFNTGINKKEQTIVTSTGPFAITWSLKKIVKGDKTPYLIKKYNSPIMEDNFRYGSDRKVILALKDNVTMARKNKFKEPSKEFSSHKDWQSFLDMSGDVIKKFE